MHHRSLRVLLALATAVHFSWAYMFVFQPAFVLRLYQFQWGEMDMNQYLAVSRGATFFVLGIISLLACLQPKRFGILTIVLLLAYGCFFLVDVILLAQGRMSVPVLLPEMVYFALIGTGIVRWFPALAENKAPTIPPQKSAEFSVDR